MSQEVDGRPKKSERQDLTERTRAILASQVLLFKCRNSESSLLFKCRNSESSLLFKCRNSESSLLFKCRNSELKPGGLKGGNHF